MLLLDVHYHSIDFIFIVMFQLSARDFIILVRLTRLPYAVLRGQRVPVGL